MSSVSYGIHVVFIRDYDDGEYKFKKGEVRWAVHHTDNPGMGMGSVFKDYDYINKNGNKCRWKVIYGIYDKNIKGPEDEKRGIYAICEVDQSFVESIWNIEKYLKEQRANKLKRILNEN